MIKRKDSEKTGMIQKMKKFSLDEINRKIDFCLIPFTRTTLNQKA